MISQAVYKHINSYFSKMIMYPTWLNLEAGMKECPECHSVLLLETKEIMREHECRACNLGVIARNCTCYTECVMEDFLTCPKCILCTECGTGNAKYTKTCVDCVNKPTREEKLQMEEEERKEAEEKRRLFWNGSPQQKLRYYGKQKLTILARRKKLRGYSRMSKDQLYRVLSQHVTNRDFPIRE